MDRRHFLSTTAAGVAFAQEKIRRVGLIGCGWYGKADLFRLVQVAPVEIVSLCDVDKKMLSQAAEMAAGRQKSRKTPRLYSDYRQMLKEKDLDIVLVATPDHWHALTMIEAVKSGADVYCQKPISVDVVEAQAMLAAARGREIRRRRLVSAAHQRGRGGGAGHAGGRA
jgi:predicted dehydrogenase